MSRFTKVLEAMLAKAQALDLPAFEAQIAFKDGGMLAGAVKRAEDDDTLWEVLTPAQMKDGTPKMVGIVFDDEDVKNLTFVRGEPPRSMIVPATRMPPPRIG